MERHENSWTTGAFFICTKCHKAIPAESLSQEGNCAENLKLYLKGRLKSEGQASQVRVMTSGCLDVCIDGTQAAVYNDVDGQTVTLTFHPEQEREQIYQFIQDKMKA